MGSSWCNMSRSCTECYLCTVPDTPLAYLPGCMHPNGLQPDKFPLRSNNLQTEMICVKNSNI